MNGLTLKQLQACAPGAVKAGVKLEPVLSALNASMEWADIGTVVRQRAYLAQLLHESNQFRNLVEELENPSAYDGRMGNHSPGDGHRFRGRGPIQLTGRANYAAAGVTLGLNLLEHPDRVADELDVGFLTAAWFWKAHRLNLLADAGYFKAITQRINGGDNGEASREWYLKQVSTVLK